MINKVILIGNLGADPESRSTSGGSTVVNLRLATTERRKDKDGNWSDHTEWHSVVAFGRTAENVAQYCAKGKQLYIEGRLQTRKWQDKEGNDRYSTEVVADTVRFLGGREGGGQGSGGGGGSYGGGGNYGGGGGGGGGAQGGGGRSQGGGGRSQGGGGGRGNYGGGGRQQQGGGHQQPAQDDYAYTDEALPF